MLNENSNTSRYLYVLKLLQLHLTSNPRLTSLPTRSAGYLNTFGMILSH